MKRLLLASAIVLLVSACSDPTPEERTAAINSQMESVRTANTSTQVIDIGGTPVKCLPASDTGQGTGDTELKGDLRSRVLTPEAEEAGVRVFVGGRSVADYGSTVIMYTNTDASCYLWSEALSLQEYNDKLGLSPLLVTTGYKASADQ